MSVPKLTFFCELDAPQLQALFAQKDVRESLHAMGAGVSMAVRDFAPERAEVVRELTRAGIPVTAWLVLPEEKGYWFNAENVSDALEVAERFLNWTGEEGLEWAGVGLDIEPHMAEWRMLQSGRLLALLRRVWRRVFNPERIWHAEATYAMLVEKLHRAGYRVESYQLPFIADERMVGGDFLRRLTGIVDIQVDTEVLMLYSSFFRRQGAAMLWSYGPHARAMGVGSTGGGVATGELDRIAPLSWEELSRDLLLARRWADEVYLFSLEGCVEQGYLGQLATFDWDAPAPAAPNLRQIECMRRALRALLWAGTHPWMTAAVICGTLWLLGRTKRRRRR